MSRGKIRCYTFDMSLKVNIFGSFSYAIDGIKQAFRNEPNFRVHVLIAFFVILIASFLGLNSIEWFSLLFTISFVIILELLNTAIEKVIDIISPTYHEKAKIAKDVSAAAVLIASLFAASVGFIILAPKIL
jgi:diacylglycerol kinase